MSVINKSE